MRHVLVVQLARFGDVLQSNRLMLSLAREPDTTPHLCVDASLASLAARIYPFAEVHALPCHAGPGATGVWTAALAVFARLAALKPEAVYFLNASPLSYAMASLFPPEIVRGYCRDNGQDKRDAWCAMAGRLTRKRRVSPLNLVDFWAFFHPDPVAPEAVNPLPKPANSGRVGVVLAGRESRRSLPPPVLAACMQAVFQARGGPTLVCMGSKAERPLVRQLARLLPSQTAQRLENTAGETALADLPDMVAGLDLVLTPDTGIMHLAAHLGVPVQAFFLSSAWCFETGPYGQSHLVWQATAACAPCLESSPCAHDLKCLPPFSHPGFLAHLAGKRAPEWPQGLMGCVSGFDALGVTFTPVDGPDPDEAVRYGLRNGLMEYLGIAVHGPVSAHAEQTLYEERDWMGPSRPEPCRRAVQGRYATTP